MLALLYLQETSEMSNIQTAIIINRIIDVKHVFLTCDDEMEDVFQMTTRRKTRYKAS